MSERKTAEIKLRVTPTFKAMLAAAAEEIGESMSEYIEKAVEDRERARKSASGLAEFIRTNVAATPPPLTREVLEVGAEQVFPLGKPNPFVARELTLEERSQFAAPFTGTPTPLEDLLDADEPTSEEAPTYDWMFRG